MVFKKNLNKKKSALISVYNKDGLLDVCKTLKKFNFNLISTGGTEKFIKKNGFKCANVSSLTNFKEILDGRVKTIHPKIHASLLFDRKNKDHVRLFNKLNFPIIELVIVNLYPFEETLKKYGDINKCIEMIDIGGLALLRSSAKNFFSTTTISDPKNYLSLITNLVKNKGNTSYNFRKKMAAKAFKLTSNYDKKISDSFTKNNLIPSENIDYTNLRYGENPHQKAEIIFDRKSQNFYNNKLQGKEISYNNLLDMDVALNCSNEFIEPTVCIVKHNNPCGVASSKKILDAFNKAYACDPISAFGGIISLNRRVNYVLARKINSFFFEVIIAKKFSKEAKKVFDNKKNLILIETEKINKTNNKDEREVRSIQGGIIIQDKNYIKINNKNIQCVSFKKATKNEIDDLIFAFKISKFVKSNSIVLVRNKKTIGIGAGQMSRIDSTKLAIKKIPKNYQNKKFVAASDAFFPFIDNIRYLSKKNCTAIIQPYGSKNDSKIIDYANKKRLSLYFSNIRLFKH